LLFDIWDQPALALGVGRGLAGALEAGLLAFLHAGVAGQKLLVAQRGLHVRVHLDERPGQPKLDRVALAGNAATVDVNGHVVAAFLADNPKRLQNVIQVPAAGNVLGAVLIVDDNPARSAGEDTHARARGLATPDAFVILCRHAISLLN